MTRVVVCGIGGRMGQTLVRLARDAEDVDIIAGIDRQVASGEAARALGVERVVEMADAGPVIGKADVVLDFSSPPATHTLVTEHAKTLADRSLAVGTTGLDPETSITIEELILRLSEDLKVTSVVVTHDMHAVLSISDRVGFLHGGSMQFIGTVDEMRVCPDEELCAFMKASEYQV